MTRRCQTECTERASSKWHQLLLFLNWCCNEIRVDELLKDIGESVVVANLVILLPFLTREVKVLQNNMSSGREINEEMGQSAAEWVGERKMTTSQ